MIQNNQRIVMTTSMSIRDLTRSKAVLLDYDYIDIEDKKSSEYKGVFIPARLAADVKEFVNQKLGEQREIKKQSILKFAGIAKGDTGGMSAQEIKSTKAKKYR